MKGPEELLNNMDVLRTSMGACFVGERAVFRGHDLHADLKDMDWVELYVFGITGRRFSKEQLRLMHAMWTYTSYPDARIWNNRVVALTGGSRSISTLGLAAALAVTDAQVYGGYPALRAIDFFIRTRAKHDQNQSIHQIIKTEKQSRRIYGYGRPINAADERLPWMLELAETLGLDKGPYLKLAFEVEKVLLENNKDLRMNYAGLIAALAADMELSVSEFHLFMFVGCLAGMPPCHVEAFDGSVGAVFPLACVHVIYEGVAQRSWRSTTTS